MLKDEAVISSEKMEKIDLKKIATSVVDDFNSIYESKRSISIKLKTNGSENYYILGIKFVSLVQGNMCYIYIRGFIS